MQIISFIFSFFLTTVHAEEVHLDSYVEDKQFLSCMMNQYQEKHPLEGSFLTLTQAEEIQSLDCSGKSIKSTVGLEKLPNLIDLNLSNNQILEIDVSKNMALQKLDLSHNQIKNIFLGNNLLLNTLDLSHNHLEKLDIKNNLNILHLNIEDNPFSIEISSQKRKFQSVIQYNPYYLEKLEDMEYTSDPFEVQFDQYGRFDELPQGDVQLFKRYWIRDGKLEQQIQEVNVVRFDQPDEKLFTYRNNLFYLSLLGLSLLLLGIFAIIKYSKKR